jgi:hypothetical protein
MFIYADVSERVSEVVAVRSARMLLVHGLPQAATGSSGSPGWFRPESVARPSGAPRGDLSGLRAGDARGDQLHGRRPDARRAPLRSRSRPGAVGGVGHCPDCGVSDRGYHHLGCDLEDCPRCRRQLISCGCAWLDEDTESIVAVAGDTVAHPAACASHPFRGSRGRPAQRDRRRAAPRPTRRGRSPQCTAPCPPPHGTWPTAGRSHRRRRGPRRGGA